MRALVVEDGSKMAVLLRRGLQEKGFAVDVAANGEDGSWLGAENDYDVILLDVMPPDVDGFEVCRRLRAGTVGSDPDAHGPGGRPGPRGGPGRRRRRLPHEAAVYGVEIRLNDGSVVDVALDAKLPCPSVTRPMTRAPQARKAQPARTAGTKTDGSAPDRLSRRHPGLATAFSLATRSSTAAC